jgi:ubiquinone/menaquinone biosynthesis C-methylase UbiE
MTFYQESIYPHLVDKLGDPLPIKRIRQQIIPLARGNVLEIGTGSGANFPHYDSDKVSKLYALEPNPGMIKLAERQKQRTKLNIEFLDLPGEQIPLGKETIDTVVSTFTLCTITKIAEAMKGIARVLKPDGQLIFFELGFAPESEVLSWQRRLEPICRQLFQGLYLTRDIPSIIRRAGFQITKMESGYMAQFPKSLSYCWWGAATKSKTKYDYFSIDEDPE